MKGWDWRFRLARLGYNLAIHLLIPLVLLHFLWRSRREPGYRRHLGERFALGARVSRKPDLWIHAVSLGEMRVAGTVVRALTERHPQMQILLTTGTPAGRAEAERIRETGLPVSIRYLPLDAPGLVRRFIHRNRPATLVLVETELWPNLLWQTHRAGLTTVLVNGRLSPRLRATYRRFNRLYTPLLAVLKCVGAQDPADADHFRKLGASRVTVTGNLKFDLPEQPPAAVLTRGRFAGDRLWLAGSTHPGEESRLLDIHCRIRAAHSGLQVQLLLAPRHPARAQEAKALGLERSLSVVLRSELDTAAIVADVVVLDTLGELPGLYGIADAAFVGGSLVARGGQNPLEAIVAGCPVVMGPDSRNFASMIERLREADAIVLAADADAVCEALTELLRNPPARLAQAEKARQVLGANRGATARTLTLLEPLISDRDPDPARHRQG